MTTSELTVSTFLSFPPSPESPLTIQAKATNAGDGKNPFAPKNQLTGIFESSVALTSQVLEVRDICTRSAIQLASHPAAHIRSQTALTCKEIHSVKSDCSKGTTTFCSLKDKQSRGFDAMDALLRGSAVPRRERQPETLGSQPLTNPADYVGLAMVDPFMPSTPKEGIEHGMKIVNLLSIPGRVTKSVCNSSDATKKVCSVIETGFSSLESGIDWVFGLPAHMGEGVKLLCDSTETTKKGCSAIKTAAELSLSAAGKSIEKTKQALPVGVKQGVSTFVQNIKGSLSPHVRKKDFGETLVQDFGIPAQDVAYFQESCGIVQQTLKKGLVVAGTYGLASAALKGTRNTVGQLVRTAGLKCAPELYSGDIRVASYSLHKTRDNLLYVSVHDIKAKGRVNAAVYALKVFAEIEENARKMGCHQLVLDLGLWGVSNPLSVDLLKKRFLLGNHAQQRVLEGWFSPRFKVDLTQKSLYTHASPAKPFVFAHLETLSIEQKKAAAWSDYVNGLKAEKSLVASFSPVELDKFLPAGFPKHLNQFFAECQTHPFKGKKLGASGKGKLEGTLLYKSMEQDALFVIQHQSASPAVRAKIGPVELLKSTHLKWNERLEYTLDTITQLAQEKGFKRIFLVWDSQKLPLVTVIEADRFKQILGTSTFSAGRHKNPLSIIEIALTPKNYYS